jgi:hypothetical protein
MLSKAKLAYLLSTCHNFTNIFMRSMISQYEKSKLVATRHYFELYITLSEPTGTEFGINKIKPYFMNTGSNIIMEALQYYNDSILTSAEMKKIYYNLLKQGIKLDTYQIIAMYSIASLIKVYKKENFKFIFIPVIINYGRTDNVVHQTSLIIDISNNSKFIYYEPYGLYRKYGKSYKNAINTLMMGFQGFQGMDINYTTYHDYIGHIKGIQGILLDKNNLRNTEFDYKFENVVNEIQINFPENDFLKNNYNKRAIDTSDKTVQILDLLSNFSKFDIVNLDDRRISNYHNILDEILNLYYLYNSKTCVSITIVEMNYFFKYYELHNDINKTTHDLLNMYEKYNTPIPNVILMDEIYILLDLLKNRKCIKKIIDQNIQSHKICNQINNINFEI